MINDPVPVRLGVIGGFQSGKSTLINCLFDRQVAATGGKGIPLTKFPTLYTYAEISSELNIAAPAAMQQMRLWQPMLREFDLVDTPGFDVAETDNELAIRTIKIMDALILVLNNKGGLNDFEKEILTTIRKYQKPFIVLLNCTHNIGELWDPLSAANVTISAEIGAHLQKLGHRPLMIRNREIWPCNLAWFWYATGRMTVNESKRDNFLISQLQLFIKDNPAANASPYEYFAAQSNFIPFRQSLCGMGAYLFPKNFIRWHATVNQAFEQWASGIRQCISLM